MTHFDMFFQTKKISSKLAYRQLRAGQSPILRRVFLNTKILLLTITVFSSSVVAHCQLPSYKHDFELTQGYKDSSGTTVQTRIIVNSYNPKRRLSKSTIKDSEGLKMGRCKRKYNRRGQLLFARWTRPNSGFLPDRSIHKYNYNSKGELISGKWRSSEHKRKSSLEYFDDKKVEKRSSGIVVHYYISNRLTDSAEYYIKDKYLNTVYYSYEKDSLLVLTSLKFPKRKEIKLPNGHHFSMGSISYIYDSYGFVIEIKSSYSTRLITRDSLHRVIKSVERNAGVNGYSVIETIHYK